MSNISCWREAENVEDTLDRCEPFLHPLSNDEMLARLDYIAAPEHEVYFGPGVQDACRAAAARLREFIAKGGGDE